MSTHVSKATRRRPGSSGVRPTIASTVARASDSLPASTDNSAQQRDSSGGTTFIEPEQRRAMIAEAAYYRAEQRGFEPGQELADWCAAENEVDNMLLRRGQPVACRDLIDRVPTTPTTDRPR